MKTPNQILECRLIPECFDCPHIMINYDKRNDTIHTIRGATIENVAAEIWCEHESVCVTMMQTQRPDISALVEKFFDEEESNESV